MTEEQVEEVAAPEVAEAAPEQEAQPEVKKSADYNWQQANSVMAAQKAEIEALKAHMAALAAQKPAAPEEPDELDALDPNDVLTVAQARAMATKQAKAAAKEIVQQHLAQHTLVNDEQRMRDKTEDYDYVVENFAVPLIKNDPALAYQVKNSKNPAETAYRLGKLSDQYQEQTTKQAVSPKAQKIMKNASRPVSANAVGSPLKAQAEEFSKMSQQQIWEMSQKYARGGT